MAVDGELCDIEVPGEEVVVVENSAAIAFLGSSLVTVSPEFGRRYRRPQNPQTTDSALPRPNRPMKSSPKFCGGHDRQERGRRTNSLFGSDAFLGRQKKCKCQLIGLLVIDDRLFFMGLSPCSIESFLPFLALMLVCKSADSQASLCTPTSPRVE